MSNEINPLVNLGKINWFGTTHHGVVRGNVLTKPDLSTVSYPQPGNGSARLVEFQGTPPVPDAAASAGMLDYALLSGGYLYGKSVGGQLYKSESGVVYRVFATNVQVNLFTNAVYFDVLGLEFGRVTIPPPSPDQVYKIRTVSFSHPEVADFDQLLFPTLVNASKDGSKSVWKIGGRLHFFVEVTISGEFSASVAILKTISQVIAVSGTISSNAIPNYQVINPVPTVSGVNIGLPTSDGQTAGATNASMTPYLTSAPDEKEEHNLIVIEHVVTAFYTRSGALKFVSVKVTSALEESVSIDVPTGGGTATWNVPGWESHEQGIGGGSFAWAEDDIPTISSVRWDFHSTRNSVYTLSVELKLDGAVLTELDAEVHQDFVNTFYTTNYPNIVIAGMSSPNSAPHGSGEPSQVSVPTIITNTADTFSTNEIDTGVDEDMWMTLDSYTKMKDAYEAWEINGNAPTLAAMLDEILGSSDNEILVHQPGCNMVCLQYQKKNSTEDAGFYEVAHPYGSDNTTWIGSRDHHYGTYHPVTDEIIRNQSERVCFV